ncbi:MAG: PorT family protein, partial [Prevotella sp.]|nr:PorT family protein [Prevotella sp.]
MIKKYILIFLCSSFTLLVFGQKDEFKKEWNIGVGIGSTFSAVDFQPRVSTKNRMQYQGGIAIRYLSERNLGIIAELNYSQQGWEQNFKNDDEKEFQHSHQLNYLELPILTHIYFGNKVRFIFNLGPKISYLMSDSEKMNDALESYLSGGNVPVNFITHQYYRSAEQKIDYGLMAGLGLEFRTGIGNFTFEGRYTFGLGDIYKSSKADYFSRSANRVMSAKLTYYVK